MIKIVYGRRKRDKLYYDTEKLTLTDKEGNVFKLIESLDGISEKVLPDYIDTFIHEYYRLINSFKNTCKGLKDKSINWEDFHW